MKNRILILICLMAVIALCGAPLAEAQKGTKIGFVDLSRLFDDYYKTIDYDKVLEAKHKGFEDERNTMVEKIKEAQGKLSLLKEDQRAAQEADIEKMKADLLEYDGQKKADMTKERNEKIREILLEIENVVSSYAEKEGYSVILNDRVLIYGDPAIDLTESVLKTLNESKPK